MTLYISYIMNYIQLWSKPWSREVSPGVKNRFPWSREQ